MSKAFLAGFLLVVLLTEARPSNVTTPYFEIVPPGTVAEVLFEQVKPETLTDQFKVGERYLQIAKYDSALYHLLDAVKLLEHQNADFLLGKVYASLGLVYFKLGDPPRALEYFVKAEKLLANTSSCAELAKLYIDIGMTLTDGEKIDSASHFFEKASELCLPSCGNSVHMRLQAAEGIALLKKGDITRALLKLDSGLALARRIKDRRAVAEISVQLSAAYYETGDYEIADDLLVDLESLACGLDLNDVLLDVYRQQGLLMSHRGDLQSQAEYQAKFIELSEQIYNEHIMARLAELEINFKERENIQMIEQQKRALALSDITLKKKKRLIFLGVVCVALGTIVAIMLLRAVRRKKVTINNLVDEVEDATAMLEDRIWQEQNDVTSKDIELRSILQKMKADVASLLGICMVASKHSGNEGTKERFEQVQRDLIALKRRMERL